MSDPVDVVVCPSCGAQNRSSTKFCGHCGTPLAAVPATPTNARAAAVADLPAGTGLVSSSSGTSGSMFGRLGDRLRRASIAGIAVVLIVLVVVAVVVPSALAKPAQVDATGPGTGAGTGTQSTSSPANTSDPSPSTGSSTASSELGAGFISDNPSAYLTGSDSNFPGLGFVMPSENVYCGYIDSGDGSPATIGCRIDSYTFVPPTFGSGQPGAGSGQCEASYGDVIELDAQGTPTFVCHGDPQFSYAGDEPAVGVLPYGHSLTYKGVVFLSVSTGVMVLNVSTGHGFGFSKSHYTLY